MYRAPVEENAGPSTMPSFWAKGDDCSATLPSEVGDLLPFQNERRIYSENNVVMQPFGVEKRRGQERLLWRLGRTTAALHYQS
eukprot:6470834-Amphidinium_carterae.1